MPNDNEDQISATQQNQASEADCHTSSGIVRHSTCWMAPPFGAGEPKEVDATPAVLTPLMVAGWSQCEPPANTQEVTTHVDD